MNDLKYLFTTYFICVIEYNIHKHKKHNVRKLKPFLFISVMLSVKLNIVYIGYTSF